MPRLNLVHPSTGLQVKQGIEVLVEPSPRRIFPDSAYAAVGAKITEDISAAPVIVGVKEVAMDQLLPEHTYMFFSHVIKAQVCDSEASSVARPPDHGRRLA